MSKLPHMRRATAAKETMIATELEKARARFSGEAAEEPVARCAMDDILRRELAAAEKENREPVYNTRTVFDEVTALLFSFGTNASLIRNEVVRPAGCRP
jgi:hypothetical protein